MSRIADLMQTMDYGPAPEADEAVRSWLKSREAGFGAFIGGQFAKPGALVDVIEPGRGARIAGVSRPMAADIDAAVAAARRALKGWSGLEGGERARHLYALARLVQKRERFFAVLETINTGRPIRDARDVDIPLVARSFYHHAGWAAIIEEEFAGAKPIGVCASVVAEAAPLRQLVEQIAPALAAGNSVVAMAFSPLSAFALAELTGEAGLPPGVVNIVAGDAEAAVALARHDGVDKLAVIGPADLGRALRLASAGTGKALSLSLPGTTHFVVFDDADLDGALDAVIDGLGRPARLWLAEGVADKAFGRLKTRIAALSVGDPLDQANDIGALGSAAERDRLAAACAGLNWHGSSGPLPEAGFFFPATLIEGVDPASPLSSEPFAGPLITATTFRTPDEAIALVNNARQGFAASLWTQDLDRALAAATKLKVGVVWVNASHLLDAAAPFGGYRESGAGRDGGREGLLEYLIADPLPRRRAEPAQAVVLSAAPGPAPANPGIDRTAKLYIGGKQVRPDSGASYSVLDRKGRAVGQAGLGGAGDIAKAVEAASKASGWAAASAHNRAQVLYYLAENLSARAAEFAQRLQAMTGANGGEEVEAAIRRLFFYAGFADKVDGAAPAAKAGALTLALNEPFGVVGLVCPEEAPLLALVSLVAPAMALGNAVVVVPSAAHPLAATDFYSVLEASDVPAGVVNIVTGATEPLAKTLAAHDGVDALWYCGDRDQAKRLEAASAGNLKFTWDQGLGVDWRAAQGRAFLRRARQVKTLWIPYGE